MITRRINFLVTIGSYWKDNFQNMRTLPIVEDNSSKNNAIEFETDNKAPFDDACNALGKFLDRDDYHIWYWTWLDQYIKEKENET